MERTARFFCNPTQLILGRLLVACALAAGALAIAPPALAQNVANPVYVDDSTAAADAIAQARSRLASDDLSEAVRLIQDVMGDEGDRLLASSHDPDLFVTARNQLIAFLLEQPRLLARYRELQSPVASALLDEGRTDQVAREYFLTEAGFEATLRVAERRLERAQFNSAWRTLALTADHPDRAGARAERALRLLTRILQYTNAIGAEALAADWRMELGVPPIPLAPIAGPPRAEGRNTLTPGPDVNLTDLIAQPLATQSIAMPADRVQGDPRSRNRQQRLNATTPLNYMLPTIAGDLIYINDGRTFSAWGRFTLEPVWTYRYVPEEDANMRSHTTSGRTAIEDLATLTVSGRWAIGIGGIATSGVRDDNDAIHAVDAATGSPRWSVRLEDVDSSLAEGSIRGPVTLDQGVAVLGVLKSIKERRLLSFHAIGLDMHSGSLLWSRPLASAGTLPYGANAKIADIPAVADGLIFQMDALGFASAVEAVTGRVQWLRRMPLQNIIAAGRRTWEGSSVVAREGVVYFIAPDRRTVVSIDAETGDILTQRSSADFRDPEYLVRAGDHLIAVAEDRVIALPFDLFDDQGTAPAVILDARDASIEGRIAVAGNRVIAPVPEGVRVAEVDAQDPSAATTALLDSPGNLVALESELVVADEDEIHTYLIWDVAERVLTTRMQATPLDPAPAATFVDLAFRAGRPDRILPAVDSALTAIERNPLDDHNRSVRERLFNSLWGIVSIDGRRVEARTITPELKGELIDRLGRAAGSPAERVRHLLAEGSYNEAIDEPRRAVDSYQQILDSPTLRATRFESSGVAAQADIEATKGLKRIVRRFGPRVYDIYDADAARSLAALSDSQDPTAFVDVAQRFPVSQSAAQAWLMAGERFEQQGRTRRALAALEDGLDAARDSMINDPALLGELAGRLITSLVDAGRLETAASALVSIRESHPNVVLTRAGRTLAYETLESQVSDLLSAARRKPRIGLPGAEPSTQLLVGWRIVRPLISDAAPPSTESAVMRFDGAIGLWRIDPASGLREVWRYPINDEAVVIALTWDAVFLLEPSPGGRAIVRLDRADGRVQWRTAPLRDLMPTGEDRAGGVATFLAMDRRSIAAVRTDGVAASFDLHTGDRLWSSPSILPIVADIAADSETLLVVGDRTSPNPQLPALDPSPAMVALDLRTGQIVKRLDLPVGQARWARLTPESLAIVGGDLGAFAYDVLRDRQVWVADDLAGLRTIDAWAFPDRVIVLDADAGLWQITLGDERPESRPLDTRGRLTRSVVTNETIHAGHFDDAVAITSSDGVLVYDQLGELVGFDRRGDDAIVLPAAIGAETLVTVTTSPAFFDDDAKWHDLFFLRAPDAALKQRRLIELNAAPEDMLLLDGRILITAGKATLVLDANPD